MTINITKIVNYSLLLIYIVFFPVSPYVRYKWLSTHILSKGHEKRHWISIVVTDKNYRVDNYTDEN